MIFSITAGEKQAVDREQMPSVRPSLLLLAESVLRRAPAMKWFVPIGSVWVLIQCEFAAF